MNLPEYLGIAIYESHGAYFEELIAADIDPLKYYDAHKAWGDCDRIIAKVSVLRGARSYEEYVALFKDLKRDVNDRLVSSRVFARVTGIKKTASTQTERTRNYRKRQASELAALRELTAKTWIEHNRQEAIAYIKSLESIKTIDK